MTDILLQGFRAFRDETYKNSSSIMPRLVREGQAPNYFIISCIDSRSNPATLFRPEPGTFFAHKAMGAIVRPYKKGTALAAALQFALIHNRVEHIIILGHTKCGAIKALVEKLEDEEISSFIEVAQQALDRAHHHCGHHCEHEELIKLTEKEIVLLSAENLKTYPSVQKALDENRVTIHPWLFEMESGQLFEYQPTKQSFVSLTNET